MPTRQHDLTLTPVNLVDELGLVVGDTYNLQAELAGGLVVVVESATEPADGPKVKNFGWVQVTVEAGIGVWAWAGVPGILWVNDN